MMTRSDEYFLTVIKCGSLSKAAEALYISQPSLTKQIKHLEARLGTHLFNHDSKPLQLNAAGGDLSAVPPGNHAERRPIAEKAAGSQ